MVDQNSCVALYPTHEQAEAAVQLLQNSGFDAENISIVGPSAQHGAEPSGLYSTGERIKFWGERGAFWGGACGLLFGVALFWIPGLGPVIMVGPLVAVLVATLESAVVVGGLSALGAALYSIGIPRESVIRYEDAIKSAQYLLMVHGSHGGVARAHEVLAASEPIDMAIHLG